MRRTPGGGGKMKVAARLFGLGGRATGKPRARLRLEPGDTPIYAIGDVHGCLRELQALERHIEEDARTLPGQKLIVMLGDYVDRGSSSAQVLNHLLAPAPAGFTRICLAGNHEIAMLDYLEGRISLQSWLAMGAEPTLFSYGIDHSHLRDLHRNDREVDEAIRDVIPAAHRAFLRSMPILVEADRYVFVHAGIRPGVELARQTDHDLVFIRSDFFDQAHLLTRYVVHGHTPVEEAKREGMRVNLDTGAFFSGTLSGLRIWRGKGRYLTN